MSSHTHRWVIERNYKDNFSVFNEDMNRDICGISKKEALYAIIQEVKLSLRNATKNYSAVCFANPRGRCTFATLTLI